MAVTILVIVGLAAFLVVRIEGDATSSKGKKPVATDPTATPGNGTGASTPPTTFPGPDGTEASWVVQENSLPGTTAWQISGPTTGIAGYADHTYAQVGDVVTLYVTTPAPTFTIDAYRMGYYGGDGGRLVWQSPLETGIGQPACPVTRGTNMVACDNWAPSTQVAITSAWVQGDYLLKLVGADGAQSYVPLTIWDPQSTGTYVMKSDVYTWQAWNPYGGYDFYAGPGSCAKNVYPICTRARVVSFDRPYGYGQGAADFFGNEYPLIRFAEQHGLDLSYANDMTVEEQGGYLLKHQTLLSLGHDECWSLGERQAATTAEQHGVNMIFFGASAVLRHVRPQPSPLGPDREEVDYRDGSADPLDGNADPLEVTGNTWDAGPADWSEIPFVGEQYVGFLEPGAAPADFVVGDASSWLFKGTGLADGAHIPGVLLSDFDEFDPGSHPANLQILAHSPIPLRQTQSGIGKARGVVYSDVTYYSDPVSGAGIFDTGTVTWIPALAPCAADASCPAPVLAQMTGNLFVVFGSGPAGRTTPSLANYGQVYGGRA